jgi:hypothetical protein
MTNPRILRNGMLLAAALAVFAVGCSDDSGSGDASGSDDTETPATTSVAGMPYSTQYFSTPLDLALPSFIDPAPAEESANFVTWGSPDGSVAVRILRPVVLYPPGSTETAPLPDDYVGYLLAQTEDGAHFADREDLTVDGHEAVAVTATTDQSIDGSMGCQEEGMTADDCYGLQPEFSIRVAVVDSDDGPLLVWVRNDADGPPSDLDAASGRLDSVLAGLRFADRPVEEAPAEAAPVDTEYDGTYEWTITPADARRYGTPSDQSAEGMAFYPNTFTAVLHDGVFDLDFSSGDPTETDVYQAAPGHLLLGALPDGISADVVQDPDGTLHLTPSGTNVDAGGVFVLTTKPWVPVG